MLIHPDPRSRLEATDIVGAIRRLKVNFVMPRGNRAGDCCAPREAPLASQQAELFIG